MMISTHFIMFRKNAKIAAKMGTNKADLCQSSDMTCKLQVVYICTIAKQTQPMYSLIIKCLALSIQTYKMTQWSCKFSLKANTHSM